MLQDGDKMTIDAQTRLMDVHVSEEEMEKRRKAWVPPPLKVSRGTLYKYIKNVESASKGCVTDE